MTAVDVFSIIKDIFLAGAAATTAYVAYTGLEKWQKELRGKASFEVARELIKSIYKLRDALRGYRSPFISASEFPEGYQHSFDKRTNEEKGRTWAYVYSKRWEPIGEAMRNFDVAVLEAEVLWGRDIKDKANELRQCVRILRVDTEIVIEGHFGSEILKDDRELEKKYDPLSGIQSLKITN